MDRRRRHLYRELGCEEINLFALYRIDRLSEIYSQIIKRPSENHFSRFRRPFYSLNIFPYGDPHHIYETVLTRKSEQRLFTKNADLVGMVVGQVEFLVLFVQEYIRQGFVAVLVGGVQAAFLGL